MGSEILLFIFLGLLIIVLPFVIVSGFPSISLLDINWDLLQKLIGWGSFIIYPVLAFFLLKKKGKASKTLFVILTVLMFIILIFLGIANLLR